MRVNSAPDAGDITFGDNFPGGIFAEVIALSPAYLGAYGDPGPLFTGDDPDAHCFLENLTYDLHDLIDPPDQWSVRSRARDQLEQRRRGCPGRPRHHDLARSQHGVFRRHDDPCGLRRSST